MAIRDGDVVVTKVRAALERDLLPAFARRFAATDLVLNIGAGRFAYREHFGCRVVTSDRNPEVGCDECFPAEAIPYATDSVDGLLMMGVLERLDDPMQAMRELRRVLKPLGVLLICVLDLGFPWRKPVDRWRLSAGGAAHLVREFTVLDVQQVDDWARFFVLQKPLGAR